MSIVELFGEDSSMIFEPKSFGFDISWHCQDVVRGKLFHINEGEIVPVTLDQFKNIDEFFIYLGKINVVKEFEGKQETQTLSKYSSFKLSNKYLYTLVAIKESELLSIQII